MTDENLVQKGENGAWEAAQYEAYQATQEQTDEVFALFSKVADKLKELNLPYAFMFQFAMTDDGSVGLVGEADMSYLPRSSGELLLAAGVLEHKEEPMRLVLGIGKMVHERHANQR